MNTKLKLINCILLFLYKFLKDYYNKLINTYLFSIKIRKKKHQNNINWYPNHHLLPLHHHHHRLHRRIPNIYIYFHNLKYN